MWLQGNNGYATAEQLLVDFQAKGIEVDRRHLEEVLWSLALVTSPNAPFSALPSSCQLGFQYRAFISFLDTGRVPVELTKNGNGPSSFFSCTDLSPLPGGDVTTRLLELQRLLAHDRPLSDHASINRARLLVSSCIKDLQHQQANNQGGMEDGWHRSSVRSLEARHSARHEEEAEGHIRPNESRRSLVDDGQKELRSGRGTLEPAEGPSTHSPALIPQQAGAAEEQQEEEKRGEAYPGDQELNERLPEDEGWGPAGQEEKEEEREEHTTGRRSSKQHEVQTVISESVVIEQRGEDGGLLIVEERRVSTSGGEEERVTLDYWLAAKRGDLQLLRQHWDSNPHERFRDLDAFGNTALYYSCLCGHVELTHFLLERAGGHQAVPEDEMLRNHTNALNRHVKEVLEGRKALYEILGAQERRRQEEEEDEDVGYGGFDMFALDDDEAGAGGEEAPSMEEASGGLAAEPLKGSEGGQAPSDDDLYLFND